MSDCIDSVSDEKDECCCDELVLGSDAEKQPELAIRFPFLPLCCWLKKISKIW